jgi:hypothetical protein
VTQATWPTSIPSTSPFGKPPKPAMTSQVMDELDFV